MIRAADGSPRRAPLRRPFGLQLAGQAAAAALRPWGAMAAPVIDLTHSHSLVDLTVDSDLPRGAGEALQQVRVADAAHLPKMC